MCMCKDCNKPSTVFFTSPRRGYHTHFDMTDLQIHTCSEHAKELKEEWFVNVDNMEQDQLIKDFVDKHEIELDEDYYDLFVGINTTYEETLETTKEIV